MPIFAVPAPRYALGINSGFVNDEIEYSVTQPLFVDEPATATLTLRALSSGDKWTKLGPVIASVTVPEATYGTPSHQPSDFPDVTPVLQDTCSKVFSIDEIAKGQTLTLTVPFTPQEPGEYVVAFTVQASQINKIIHLALPVDVEGAPGSP